MLLWVSLNQTECHRGIPGISWSLGVATGAFFLRRENTLHGIPQKG